MWQKSKNIKWSLIIIISAEIANIVYFVLYEYYIFSTYYCLLLFGIILISNYIIKYKEINGKGLKNEQKSIK